MKPPGGVRLHVEPVTMALANEYVELVHRHHGPVTAGPASFSIAAVDDSQVIRGVATAGIPNAANRLQDGFRTMEVVRVATDGTPNACSILYAACARAARVLGFSRIVTYVLEDETGTSIRAAGWVQDDGDFGTGNGHRSWAERNGHTRIGPNHGPKGRWSLTLAGTDRPALALPQEVETLRQQRPQLSLLS